MKLRAVLHRIDSMPAPPDLSATPERDVVRLACQRSEHAYREIVRRYERRVRRSIHHIVHHTEGAKDLAQDTLVKTFKALECNESTPQTVSYGQTLHTRRRSMTLQSFRWVLAACVLIPTGGVLAAQSSTQSEEYTALWKRIEVFEKRNNERQPPDKVMDAIGVSPGMVIGEVGAGRGRYTVHLARRVGDEGKIYANDINAEALDFLRYRCDRDGIANVEIVLGEVEDPKFPDTSLDMIFMVWVYHMVEAPVPLLRSFGTSLKPGAKVVMVEPVPEEIEQELQEATARGATDIHVNVLTTQSVADYARQAGFRLVRAMDDLLDMDIIYILEKQ